MYEILIFIKESPNNFALQYKDFIAASAAFEALSTPYANFISEGKDMLLKQNDDYGHKVLCLTSQCAGILFVDGEKEGESTIERSLLQARVQKKVNDRAKNDPILNLKGLN